MCNACFGSLENQRVTQLGRRLQDVIQVVHHTTRGARQSEIAQQLQSFDFVECPAASEPLAPAVYSCGLWRLGVLVFGLEAIVAVLEQLLHGDQRRLHAIDQGDAVLIEVGGDVRVQCGARAVDDDERFRRAGAHGFRRCHLFGHWVETVGGIELEPADGGVVIVDNSAETMSEHELEVVREGAGGIQWVV